MIKPPEHFRFTILAAWMGLVGVGWLVWNDSMIDRRPPIAVTGVEALNSPVTPGGDLLVRIYREKVRDCPLTSFRYATDWNGVRYDFEDEAKPGGGPVGTEYVDVAFPVPPDLPSGRYVFHNTAVYHCPDRDYVVIHPDVNFLARR